MKDYDQFAAEWLGRRTGDPLLIGMDGLSAATMYQCVSLIKQYWVECFGLVINYPGKGAIDLWYHTPQAALGSFDHHSGNDVRKGDIVVLHTLGTDDDTEYGHVVIATGNLNGAEFEGLEQNGQTGGGTGLGGDAVRTRYIPNSRIAGILRPKPSAPAIPYTITSVDPRQVVVNIGSHEWNLALGTFDAINNNPVSVFNGPNPVTISATLKHNALPQYTYYLPDSNNPVGYNTLDCNNYTPPAPVVPPPVGTTLTNYQPGTFPAAAKYTLVGPVPAYNTAPNAVNRRNSTASLPEGDYYVYARDSGMVNVTMANQEEGLWINPTQNIPTPPPEPTPTPEPEAAPTIQPPDTSWMNSISWFNEKTRAPRVYKTTKLLIATDVSGRSKSKITIQAGDKIHAYASFTRDFVHYARLHTKTDDNWDLWFAVPVVDSKNIQNLLLQASLGSGPVTLIRDFINFVPAKLKQTDTELGNFFFDILPGKKRKK